MKDVNMVYKGKLTKLSHNENALRTSEVVGWFPEMPKPGQSFQMFSEPLNEEMTIRAVTTSVVRSIEFVSYNELVFWTMNSTYQLSDIEAYEESH